MDTSEAGWPRLVLAGIAIGLVVAVGTVLRLADPLSDPVVPAEDPYTHMALTREHVRDGTLDPLNPPGGLYPPGLHGVLAALWIFTGADLYDITRFGPVAFGAIGILGIAVLLGRMEGLIAAFVGSLAYAVAPEVIFRTTMMSPTALDLAFFPLLLYALLEVGRGRLGWAGVALPLTLFLLFAHPWLLAMLAVAGVILGALYLALPGGGPRAYTLSAHGLAALAVLLGLAQGAALSTCGGACGPAFDNVGDLGVLSQAWPAVVLVSLGTAALLWWRADRVDAFLQAAARRNPGWITRSVAGAGATVALVGITWPAVQSGMPPFVDLPRMFGLPILIAAAVAFAAIGWMSGPGARAGISLGLATYPMVIYNPLQSEFLSHRTAVYLGLALVLLAGALGGRLANAATRGWAWLHTVLARRRAIPRRGAVAALVPALLVATTMAGTVYAATPDAYEGGWYRLYKPCELDALREIAAAIDADPDALVLTWDWHAKVVLAGLASDPSRIWIHPNFFQRQDARDPLLRGMALDDRNVIAIVDAYMLQSQTWARHTFLTQDPWTPFGTWCEAPGAPDPRIAAYLLEPGPT